MKAGLIILGVLILAYIVMVVLVRTMAGKEAVEELKTYKDYDEILKAFEVPEKHYKVVIAQSRVHAVYNCPAVIWKEEDMVKILLIKPVPKLTECEAEDFLFISSQVYMDFKQLDGSEYPDWAVQTPKVKEMFLPYVELSNSYGSLDYGRQIYWAGTICVYSRSLPQIFEMMGRPLSDYDMHIDNKKRMMEDGSIPEAMLAERRAELAARKAEEEKEQARIQNNEAMENRLDSLEKTLNELLANKSKEGVTAQQINELTEKLLSEGRLEDLKKSTKDPAYQEQLLKEYGLL